MSKSATEKVLVYCPHADKVNHKAHEKDDPMILAFGTCYLLPRVFYTEASSKPEIGKYYEDIGIKFDIGFCNRCYDKIQIPNIILDEVEKYRQKLEIDSNFIKNDNAILCKKEINCLNSDKPNKLGEMYHPPEHSGKTSDIIIRFECVLRPSEYTAYVGEQTWKFGMVADACEYCIAKVFPEITTILDRYHTMLLVSDGDVHNPDQMLSMHQVAFMSGSSPQNINQ